MTEARRSLLRQAVPVVGATLAFGLVGLLTLGVIRARRTERRARLMAEQIVPAQRSLQELDKAIADLAVTALGPHNGPRLAAARDHVEWALAHYHPEAGDGLVTHWAEVRHRVADFQQEVADEARAPRPEFAEVLPLRMGDAFAAVRAQSAISAAGAMHALDELASIERMATLGEVALLLVVGSACLLMLLRAARREEHAFNQDEAMMRRLERTNADLEAFAGRIAHDLRGPLSPILAGSQLIESAPVSTEVRRVAERIERSARRLFAMIDALLTFTRLSGEAATGACTPIAPVVDETVASFAERASQLAARFDLQIQTSTPVRCEPEIANSILQNLVENALKYGLDGSADRVVEVRAFDAPGCVVLEVEDHGRGVPANLAERVFEPLIQGQGGRGGVGLGLATVRRLVEARGGRVELRPGHAGGALFRVTLPRGGEEYAHPAGP